MFEDFFELDAVAAVDAVAADDACDADDNLLREEFFELDAVAAVDAVAADDACDADDNLLREEFFELDDAYDPFAIKPRFRLLWDEDFLTFLVTCFFLENKLPNNAPKPFLGDAGATAPTVPTLLLEECRDDADELLRLNNPGPLTPTALAGFLVNALLALALTLLNNPARTGACATTPCACAKAAIPALGDGRGDGEPEREEADDECDDDECFDADDARDANECLDADDALDDDELLRRTNPSPLTPTALAGTTLEPLNFAPILLTNPGRDNAAAARGDGSAAFLNASKRFASALFSFHILNFTLPSLYFSPIFLVVAL